MNEWMYESMGMGWICVFLLCTSDHRIMITDIDANLDDLKSSGVLQRLIGEKALSKKFKDFASL